MKGHQRRLMVWLNGKEAFGYEYLLGKDLFRLNDELEIVEESRVLVCLFNKQKKKKKKRKEKKRKKKKKEGRGRKIKY